VNSIEGTPLAQKIRDAAASGDLDVGLDADLDSDLDTFSEGNDSEG